MNLKKIFVSILMGLTFMQAKGQSVDYSIVSVPEEAGIEFV